VSVPARLLSSSPLVYPPAARQAEIESDFPVEIVVDLDGRVIAARAITRAGYDLDEAALRAIRAYRFSPAMRGGQPVRVRMRWTVQFRLR
jgi:protein TonB